MHLTHVSSMLSYLILLGGILTIAVTLYMVVISYSPLPYWDGWAEIYFASSGGNPLSPAWLWKLHNEHRLIIPKLLLAADLRLFRSRQIFLLASIFGIQLLHLALLSWSMRVLGSWCGALWRSGAGLAAFCLFCPTQYTNFIVGFQVCVMLAQFLATASFVAQLLCWTKSQQHSEKLRLTFLWVSILAALGATYSFASGNLLWPILILMALYLRLPRSAVLSYVITGVVSTWLYFGFLLLDPRLYGNPTVSNLGSPLTLVRYFARYLVGSLTLRGAHAVEFILPVGLAVVVILLYPALAYIRNFRVFGIQLALMMMFWGATVMITVAGRAHLGIEHAAEPRYQTVTLLFWCSVGLLLLGATFFARGRMRYGFLVAQVCLLVIIVYGAATVSRPIGKAREHGFELGVAAASLLTGVHDPAQLTHTSGADLESVFRMARYLQANQLSVFAGSVPSELGKPVEAVFPIISFADCAGALESIEPVGEPSAPGLRVSGWAWDARHQRPPSAIIVTRNGIITGLGAIGRWKPSVAATRPKISPDYIGYVAYLPEPRPISIINFYAILRRSPPTACRFAMM